MAVLGVTAYGLFIAATIPARLVAQRIAVPGTLELVDAQGTLWNGTARATLAAGGPAVSVDTLRWRFLPARLASGRLAFAVDAAGAGLEGQGEIARGFAILEARALNVRADVAALAAFAPLPEAWQPQGRVTISAPALAWESGHARGAATVEWRDAAVALSSVRPLGSYRIDARGDGGPAKFAVTTLEGPLRVAGSGSFVPPAALAFSGEARAEGAQAAELEPLLNLLGPRRPDGARALEWHAAPGTPPPPSR